MKIFLYQSVVGCTFSSPFICDVYSWFSIFKGQAKPNTKTIVYNIPKKLLLKNVNVLGAGDYFAAAFINCSISGLGVEASVKKAHEDTTKMLKGQ